MFDFFSKISQTKQEIEEKRQRLIVTLEGFEAEIVQYDGTPRDVTYVTIGFCGDEAVCCTTTGKLKYIIGWYGHTYRKTNYSIHEMSIKQLIKTHNALPKLMKKILKDNENLLKSIPKD